MSYQPRHQAPESHHTRPVRSRSGNEDTPRKRIPRPPRPKKNKFQLPYPAFIVLVSVILSIIIIFTANDVFSLVSEDKDVTITLPQNATVSQVAKILDDEGIIHYRSIFKLFVNLTVKDPEFLMGEHEMNTSMDYRAILRQVRRTSSSRNILQLTFPEGYTVEQIKTTLVQAGICKEEELNEALSVHEYNYDFLPKNLEEGENRLEGYLFPDTYQFYEDSDADTVVEKFLDNFDQKVTEDMRSQIEKSDYSLREILTVASMVEKEAKLSSEQAKIAGVIYNRLNSKDYPYLNIDATILYVVGHKDALTKADLKIDSPYNTYTQKGLPPGPICNPGLDAIMAAINPEKHDYYFYVASGDKDGSHVFSKTLDEHNQAVAKANANK